MIDDVSTIKCHQCGTAIYTTATFARLAHYTNARFLCDACAERTSPPSTVHNQEVQDNGN